MDWQIWKFKRDWTEFHKFQNDDFIKRTLNVKERISKDYLVYGIIERGNDLFSRSKIIRQILFVILFKMQ